MMPLYECVLIARNDVTQQQVEASPTRSPPSSSATAGR